MSHGDKLIKRINHASDTEVEIWFFEEENGFNCELGTFGYSIGRLKEAATCLFATGGFVTPEKAEEAALSAVERFIKTEARSDDDRPSDVVEWRQLPELVVSSINSETESGTSYIVQSVLVLSVPSELIAPKDQGDLPTVNGRFLLSSVGVGADKADTEWFRLPGELAEWASTVVVLAQTDPTLFPSTVEFGRLRGRYYAEFL